MGQLHELLAVEKDVRNVFQKLLQETQKTFSQRTSHFQESKKVYEALDDIERDVNEEFTPMVTTVREKLDYVEKHFAKSIDVMLQKERSNQVAKADWEVEQLDGTKKTILKDVPVTMLVQLETMLTDMRTMVYNNIPTLDPMQVWTLDPNRKNVYNAQPRKKARTAKVPKPIQLAAATKEHAAQVQLIQEDIVVGHVISTISSGALSPKQKSNIMDTLDKLISGAKIARAKANDIPVDKATVGKSIFQFLREAMAE